MKKKKIKVVHIVEGFIGGLATYMFHVLPGLCREGFDVTLICSLGRKERGMAEKLKVLHEAGVKIHYVPMRRGIAPVADLYCLVILWRLLKRGGYDIVHTHCSKAGALGRIASLLAGISARLHCSHCFAYLRYKNVFLRRLYYWIERLLSRITVKYIAVSFSEVENATKSGLFSKAKCLLIENGVPAKSQNIKVHEIEIIKTNLSIQKNTYVITTGCRFIGYKGLKLLLKAARYVNSDCHFIIAGEGQLTNRLKRYIVRHRLQEKVSLLTPTIDMDKLLRISDLAILCSRIEAQPYFLLEAMMAMCPVIATDVPGNRELLGAHRGLLIQPEPKEIANAIDGLLSDASWREHFADSAYRYVVSDHSVERQVNKIAQVYRMENEQNRLYRLGIDAQATLKKKAV